MWGKCQVCGLPCPCDETPIWEVCSFCYEDEEEDNELICWERDKQTLADIYNGLAPSLEGENR